jgi:hypothetical protein
MMNLSSQLRSFMSRSLAPENPAAEEEFNRLALDVVRVSAGGGAHLPGVVRTEQGRAGVRSGIGARFRLLPTSAFKEYEVSSIPAGERIARLPFQRHDGAGSEPPFPQCRIALDL